MSTWTNRGKLRLADATFDADNLTMALLITVPSDATARDWNTDADLVDELTTAEVSNYSRTALGTATITENDTTDEVEIDYANLAFGSLVAPAVTPGLEVVAAAAIDLTSDEVMWVQALATGVTPNGSAFTIVVPSDGAAYIDDVTA